MTKRLILVAAALAAFSCSISNAQVTAIPGDAPAMPMPPPPPQVPVNTMLEFYGWFVAQQMECYELGLDENEIAAMVRGIAIAARGKKPEGDLPGIGPALQQFIQQRSAEVGQKRAEANKVEESNLMAELDAKPTVKKTASGLRYEIIAEGTGPKPSAADTVKVHYTGTFPDGTEFDSSRGGQPAEFALNGVIVAWTQGVPLVGVGGKVRLYSPAGLAYGPGGRGGIPPSKALIFDVELLGFTPAQPTLPTPGMPQIQLAP